MKRSLFIAINVLWLHAVFAQQSLPKDLQPLKGEVTLAYAPKITTRCVMKNYVKKTDTDLEVRQDQPYLYSIKENEAGNLFLIHGTQIGDGKVLSLIFAIKKDGLGFESTPPILKSDLDIPPEQMANLPMFMTGIRKMIEDFSAVGQPLAQGSKINFNFCNGLPNLVRKNRSSEKQMSVVGIALINGENALVMSGNTSERCIASQGWVEYEANGWQAVSMKSGLTVASSMEWGVKASTGQIDSSFQDVECATLNTN